MVTRRLRVFLLVAVLLLASVFCVLFWLRASLAERWLNRNLSDLGVSPAEVRINELGLWRSSSLNSKLGYGDLALDWDYLQVDYDPRRLWGMELHGLYADGLRLQYTYRPVIIPPPLRDPIRVEDPVVVTLPDVPVPERELPDEVPGVAEPTELADRLLPTPEVIPPPVDVLALFHQVPFKNAQISRGSMALYNLDGDKIGLDFDVRMNPVANGSEWDMVFGQPGLQLQLNARVNSEQQRIRFSGNGSLSERSGWQQVPDWLEQTAGLADWHQWFNLDWDWQLARWQFLADWEAGQVAGISLELEVDGLHWQHASGLATGDGGHMVATFSDAGRGGQIFAGIAFPGLHWQNWQIALSYAEFSGNWLQDWQLAWAPAQISFEQQALGEWAGQLTGDFGGQYFHMESYFQPRWESDPLLSLELKAERSQKSSSLLFAEVINRENERVLILESELPKENIYRSKGNMRLNLNAGTWQRLGLPFNAGMDWSAGELRGLLNWDLSGFLPRGSGSVIIFDAALSDITGDWQSTGVNLNLPMRLLGFPQTTGQPRLTIDKIEASDFIVTNLVMDFRMTTLDDFRVERLQGEMAGGRWRFRPFSFDIREPRFSTAIEFENLDGKVLQQWLPEGNYHLHGKVEGVWPVEYRNGVFFAGHGIFRLTAKSGGRLTFTDAAWLKETLAFAAGAPLELEDRLLEAMLSGITIDSLEIHLLDPAQPDAPLWMKVSGKARTERLIVPVEGLVIRNRLQPEELLDLLDMLGLPFLRPATP